jgi:tRNA-dihydrouridine synthase A
VQRGAFGACLMAEPRLVADCVAAMRSAVRLPVTVKHRIGIDRQERYDFVRDFVGTVAEGGCEVFIVHARNAWLKGLSPKENRELPPLRHAVVARLKVDFPQLTFVSNGGIASDGAIADRLQAVDGVMIGRHAYHQPWAMTRWDERFLDAGASVLDRDAVEGTMVDYMERVAATGEPWTHVSRHILGLRHGEPGARRWRQVWSDPRLKGLGPREVSRQARAAAAASAREPAELDA